MYLFEIYVHNQCVVQECFINFKEAKERIDSWPWNINYDDCAPTLYSLMIENYDEVDMETGELKEYPESEETE